MIEFYIKRYQVIDPAWLNKKPWEVTENIRDILSDKIKYLGDDFIVDGDIAVHRSAIIEKNVVLKGPLIVSQNCFVAAHAYLRGGVYLDESVSIGPGCEVKSSFIFSRSALAHFNFVGDSVLGSDVNLEAGSVIANHFNERINKTIFVKINNQITNTGVTKFGALIGDNVKIGSNAVLSPGTILPQDSVVNRLELIEQVPPELTMGRY